MSRYIPFPILYTKRLKLRKLSIEDRQEVFFLRSDQIVNKYFERPTPRSLIEAENFIQKISDGIAKEKHIYWAISEANEKKMIGSITLWNFSEDKKTAELGYDLHYDFHNKGFMSEALKAVLNYGFGELDLIKIEAYTHFQNKGSIRLLKKIGFIIENGEKDANNKNNIVLYLESIN